LRDVTAGTREFVRPTVLRGVLQGSVTLLWSELHQAIQARSFFCPVY
jgi:uncharacterized protein YheU (UPF0270 family)